MRKTWIWILPGSPIFSIAEGLLPIFANEVVLSNLII